MSDLLKATQARPVLGLGLRWTHSQVFLSLVLGQNLFDSIKSEPFSIPEDDGNDLTHTFFNPDREGWLLKLGERPTDTRRRTHTCTRGHTLLHAHSWTHRPPADTRLTCILGDGVGQPQVSWPPVQPSACPIHPPVPRRKGASGGG